MTNRLLNIMHHSEDKRGYTIWDRKDEQFPSQWGRLTYLEWCQREIQRVRELFGKIYLLEETTTRCRIVRP